MSAWNNRQVLVTGAGGFLGSHLVEALLAEGAHVRAYVHYNSRNDWGNLELLPGGMLQSAEVVTGDVRDPVSVARAVSGCDTVFHLAALIGIPYSYRAPSAYVATNINGTLNVLEAARVASVERVIHTSTSEVYGTALRTPMDESHPLQAQSPYSATKIGADKLAESYHRSFDLPVTTLRPFNTYGPRQSLRAVIPTIVAQALAGDEVRLGSLTPVRDFTFVADTAQAFISAAERVEAVGKTLNAGSGAGISIGDLAALILEAMNSGARIVTDSERVRPDASEVGELLCDSSELRRLTGWAPRVALREGLARTVAWLDARLTNTKPHLYNV